MVNRKSNIMILVMVVAILAMGLIVAFVRTAGQQENLTYYSLHKARVIALAKSAIEAASLKVAEEINNNPATMSESFKEMLNTIKNGPKDSFYYLIRFPILTAYLDVMKVDKSDSKTSGFFLDPEKIANKLGWKKDWFKKEFTVDDLGLEKLIKDLNMDGKVELKCTVKLTNISPVVGRDGGVASAKKKGKLKGKLVDFVMEQFGIPDKIEVNIAKIFVTVLIKKIKKIFGQKIIGAAMGKAFKMVNAAGALDDVGKQATDVILDNLRKKGGVFNRLFGPFFDKLESLINNWEPIKKYGNFSFDIKPIIEKIVGATLAAFNLEDVNWDWDFTMEKIFTLQFEAKVKYKLPYGKTYIAKVIATKDAKVVDVQPPNPLDAFYWPNKVAGKKLTVYLEQLKYVKGTGVKFGSKSGSFGDKDLNKITGMLRIEPFYKGSQFLKDIVSGKLVKGLNAFKYLPGKVTIDSEKEQVITTSLNEWLLFLSTSAADFLPDFPSYMFGTGHWKFPSAFFKGLPISVDILIPNFGVPNSMTGFNYLPFGWGSLAAMVGYMAKKGFTNTNVQLFGKWCTSFPINLKAGGNVSKEYVEFNGFSWPWFLFFGFPIPGGVIWFVDFNKSAYSYDFLIDLVNKFTGGGKLTKALEAASNFVLKAKVDNIYPVTDYVNKATAVYASSKEFLEDTSIRDSNGVVLLNGVYFIDGDLHIGGSDPKKSLRAFWGSGVIVCSGDCIVDGDVVHVSTPEVEIKGKKVQQLAPFTIVTFGKVKASKSASIQASVFSAGGVQVDSGKTLTIYGNLILAGMNPADIKGDLVVRYDAERTFSTLLALIPYIGKFAPSRYRVVLQDGFNHYSIIRSDKF